MALPPPQVTVVLPALNAAATLPEALDSLAAQEVNWQAILVDGGSADGTPELAARWPGLEIVTAPGSSIYRALNIGIAAAAAPVVCLLNSDDVLLPGALATMLAALAAAPEAEIVRGRPRFFADTAAGDVAAAAIERLADRPLSLPQIMQGPFSINSMLFRRALFERIGPFDERLRFAADREWLLRAWAAGAHLVELPVPVYRYRVHGGSSTLDPAAGHNYGKIREEHLAIIARLVATPDGNPVWREELLRWHAVETKLALLSQMRRGEWPALAATLGSGFRRDPLWPRRLAGEAWRRFRRA